MSDLVERVARAIVSANDADPDFIHGGAPIWGVYTEEARAAIAAVAEWLEDHGKDDWFKARHIRAQLEQPK